MVKKFLFYASFERIVIFCKCCRIIATHQPGKCSILSKLLFSFEIIVKSGCDSLKVQ